MIGLYMITPFHEPQEAEPPWVNRFIFALAEELPGAPGQIVALGDQRLAFVSPGDLFNPEEVRIYQIGTRDDSSQFPVAIDTGGDDLWLFRQSLVRDESGLGIGQSLAYTDGKLYILDSNMENPTVFIYGLDADNLLQLEGQFETDLAANQTGRIVAANSDLVIRSQDELARFSYQNGNWSRVFYQNLYEETGNSVSGNLYLVNDDLVFRFNRGLERRKFNTTGTVLSPFQSFVFPGNHDINSYEFNHGQTIFSTVVGLFMLTH